MLLSLIACSLVAAVGALNFGGYFGREIPGTTILGLKVAIAVVPALVLTCSYAVFYWIMFGAQYTVLAPIVGAGASLIGCCVGARARTEQPVPLLLAVRFVQWIRKSR